MPYPAAVERGVRPLAIRRKRWHCWMSPRGAGGATTTTSWVPPPPVEGSLSHVQGPGNNCGHVRSAWWSHLPFVRRRAHGERLQRLIGGTGPSTKCQHRCAATRQLRTIQSGGFYKGRLPVRLPGDRAALWHARISPIWAAARVPLSNPLRLGSCSVRTAALRSSRSSRQPTGAGPAGAGAPAGASAWAPWRRRERPAGRLETVQKVLTASRRRIMCCRRITAVGGFWARRSPCRHVGEVFAELCHKRVIAVTAMQNPTEILSTAEKVGHGFGVEFVS